MDIRAGSGPLSEAAPRGLLSVYARAFQTVDVYRPFYAIPPEDGSTGRGTPEDFVFALQLLIITHERRSATRRPRTALLRPGASLDRARADPHAVGRFFPLGFVARPLSPRSRRTSSWPSSFAARMDPRWIIGAARGQRRAPLVRPLDSRSRCRRSPGPTATFSYVGGCVRMRGLDYSRMSVVMRSAS